jgi:hypothetical protein
VRSEAQNRILAEVREQGTLIYKGRQTRAIRALEGWGLVTVDWGRPPKTGRTRRITVTKTEETS